MSKPHHFTTQKTIGGTASIWAFPRTADEIREGKEAFRFQIRTDSPWQDEAIKVCSDDVQLTMPAGIDLLAKTIETLKEKQKDVLAQAAIKANELNEKINELQLLTYQPDPITGNDPTIIIEAETIIDRGDIPF